MATPQSLTAESARRVISRLSAAAKSLDLPMDLEITMTVFVDGQYNDSMSHGTTRRAIEMVTVHEAAAVANRQTLKFRIRAELTVIDVTRDGPAAHH